jgi:cytochrome c oxidase subunit 2
MNGFRISTKQLSKVRERRACFDSKSLHRVAAKFLMLGLAGLLPVLAGCSHTPTYSGPPNLVIHMVMKKWAIVPKRLVIPQGAHVELSVISTDVEHGIGVPGLDINQPVQPGRVTIVRFLAKTPGTYPMNCSVLCGRGHDWMKGVIVITPAPRAPVSAGRASEGRR